MALKTALLQILEEHRDAPVSGQALADRLHVSRAAVWKAMKALQAEGHRITAVTNRGYRLERDSDVRPRPPCCWPTGRRPAGAGWGGPFSPRPGRGCT